MEGRTKDRERRFFTVLIGSAVILSVLLAWQPWAGDVDCYIDGCRLYELLLAIPYFGLPVALGLIGGELFRPMSRRVTAAFSTAFVAGATWTLLILIDTSPNDPERWTAAGRAAYAVVFLVIGVLGTALAYGLITVAIYLRARRRPKTGAGDHR